jgi:hypothetical protein
MKNVSKKAIAFLWVWGFISVMFWGTVLAGDNAPVPPRGNGNQEQQLSDEQKAKVVSILSRYDSSSLTAADAKAINNAFREAGIRQGPGQHEAIEAAGYNPEKISALDPPPNRKKKGGQNSDRDE